MSNNESKQTITPNDVDRYNASITKGKEVISTGGSKADAARAIYEMIKSEVRDVIVQAFIDGANLTIKGAPTYFYNVKRQIERKERNEVKKSSAKEKKKTSD